MPFIKLENLNETTQFGLWKVTEKEEELYANLTLSPYDIEEFNNITHPVRKLEWLAARKAMQELVKNSRYEYQGIQKEQNGKAHLFNQSLHISISHTQNYAAVMLGSEKEVGIDIELIKPKIVNIAEKFISKFEIHLHEKNIIKLTLAWCAKEAIYKYIGLDGISFKQHIFLENFYFSKGSGIINGFVKHPDIQESVSLGYFFTDEYCVAYTL